jgi:hypothetical protein
MNEAFGVVSSSIGKKGKTAGKIWKLQGFDLPVEN